MNKRIAVLGSGANGSCVAADLVRAGQNVVLIDQWPAHVEAMRSNGLQVEMPGETINIEVRAHHLCDLCAVNEAYDVVLLASKAYDTRWLCELVKPNMAPDGLLVGLQNAMTAATIADVVGPSRTLGCVVELSSELFTPGIVKRNTPPARTWFGIGSFDPSTAGRESELESLLLHAGKVSISKNILSAKWMKVVTNSMLLGPVAMTGLTIADAVQRPAIKEILTKVGSEALAVGQRLGFGIEPIFGLSAAEVTDTNRLLEKLIEKIAGDIGPAARDCVLQDHLKGRYSEVDAINGLVVEESARLGLSAPANAAVVELTRRIRSGELGLHPSNLETVQAMLSA